MTNLLYPIFFVVLMWSDHFPGYDAEPMQGGQQDRDNEVIWPVSFQQKEKNGIWYHFCGGSIISSQHIVTAAHCFVEIGENETQVWNGNEETRIVFGTNDLKTPGYGLKIGKVIIPKAYSKRMGGNTYADVAVVILEDHIDPPTDGDIYGPIDIFYPKTKTERKKYDDQEGFVAGFGVIEVIFGLNGKRTHIYDGLLRILPVQFTDLWCPKLHGLRCVQYTNISEEPKGPGCGNSGGPLYYRSDNKFELVGVLSTSPIDFDIRKSCGKHTTVMFLPDFKHFLRKAKHLNFKATFPEMSVEDFEESGIDYIVLPDQAELAREYYALPIEEREKKKPCRSRWRAFLESFRAKFQ